VATAGFAFTTPALTLTLPLPGGGGGPPGGGAIPAGVSGGPGCMCNINSLGLVFPFIRHPFVVFWPFSMCVCVAFPPNEIVVAPEPGGPGGGCPPYCETSMGSVSPGRGLACFTMLSTYDWSTESAPDGPM
jgi:hypothetical protein